MSDQDTTLAQLRQQVSHFVAARDWEIYHTPKNLSVAVAIEAAELMEQFLWLTPEQAAAALQDPQRRAAVVDELADVLIYALSAANALGVDVSAVVAAKLERNERRFPVDQWLGRARGVEDASGRTEG
jgi:dCTP diphosphatase